MFEVSNLHESANWIGIITTPSATLTIDQLNSFGKHLKELDLSNLPTIVKETLDHFSTIMYTVDVASTYFIKYPVPFKNIENDCYSLAWPFAYGQDLSEIEKKLNSFLNYNKFQTEDIDHDLYVKYRNTQKFYNKIQNEKKLILKAISKLEQTIKKHKNDTPN
jgi:hypothetical protein